MSAVPVPQVPADLGALPGECPRWYLVTLENETRSSLHAIYSLATFADPANPPCVGKVLWYLAAEASHVEQSRRDAIRWARLRGYDAADRATSECFVQRVETADRLVKILGERAYHSLLALYESSKGHGS